MKLMLINGSVREGRASDKIQDWVLDVLKNESDLEIDVADLKEVDLPFYDEAMPPSAPNMTYTNPKGTAWAKRVAEADAFLLLTAEYNHGPTPVLKNAIDWVYSGWNYKPVGFVSYGAAAGGTRAVQQLKQNLLNVRAFPTTSNIHLFLWGGSVDDNGRPLPEFDDRLKGLLTEIKELGARLKS